MLLHMAETAGENARHHVTWQIWSPAIGCTKQGAHAHARSQTLLTQLGAGLECGRPRLTWARRQGLEGAREFRGKGKKLPLPACFLFSVSVTQQRSAPWQPLSLPFLVSSHSQKPPPRGPGRDWSTVLGGLGPPSSLWGAVAQPCCSQKSTSVSAEAPLPSQSPNTCSLGPLC